MCFFFPPSLRLGQLHPSITATLLIYVSKFAFTALLWSAYPQCQQPHTVTSNTQFTSDFHFTSSIIAFCFLAAVSSLLASSFYRSSSFMKCYVAALRSERLPTIPCHEDTYNMAVHFIKPARRLSGLREDLVSPLFMGFHLIK